MKIPTYLTFTRKPEDIWTEDYAKGGAVHFVLILVLSNLAKETANVFEQAKVGGG